MCPALGENEGKGQHRAGVGIESLWELVVPSVILNQHHHQRVRNDRANLAQIYITDCGRETVKNLSFLGLRN